MRGVILKKKKKKKTNVIEDILKIHRARWKFQTIFSASIKLIKHIREIY